MSFIIAVCKCDFLKTDYLSPHSYRASASAKCEQMTPAQVRGCPLIAFIDETPLESSPTLDELELRATCREAGVHRSRHICSVLLSMHRRLQRGFGCNECGS